MISSSSPIMTSEKAEMAVWIDQKCTADVVTIISDFIYDYVANHPGCSFSSSDIWYSEYASQTVEAVFKKPRVDNSNAKHEYDKFFQQPMEMLANAKILLKRKQGNRNVYQVNRMDILEYIALRERNALTFLTIYIEKVLHDSGLSPVFIRFLSIALPRSLLMPSGTHSLLSRSNIPKSTNLSNAAGSLPRSSILFRMLTILMAP